MAEVCMFPDVGMIEEKGRLKVSWMSQLGKVGKGPGLAEEGNLKARKCCTEECCRDLVGRSERCDGEMAQRECPQRQDRSDR